MPSLMPSGVLWGLLYRPAVAVGIAEEDEGVPVLAAPLNRDAILEVLDRADLYSPLDQLGPRRLDVGDDELQTLQRSGRRSHGAAAHEGDRACRARRGQLHHAEDLACPVV